MIRYAAGAVAYAFLSVLFTYQYFVGEYSLPIAAVGVISATVAGVGSARACYRVENGSSPWG
ncbi:hypothetical protein BRD01_14340 [Halobacteriales archaeon QS_8_65_32]|jgi:hypothetical protein|nr:MAG: hypothetical protein BRD01_14340 [Halobacteriales archaeon QS_8_65_32]